MDSFYFFFQAEDGIRDATVTGVQTCALPISRSPVARGRPCAASACAPTMRNSAPAADNASNISPKSRFIPTAILEGPRFARELPNHCDALSRTHASKFLRIRDRAQRGTPRRIFRAVLWRHETIIGCRRNAITLHFTRRESAPNLGGPSPARAFARQRGAYSRI